MTQCQYGGICENSTFSWWGVYLNDSPDKVMIFPDAWINDCNYQREIQIYSTNSIVVKTKENSQT